MDRLEQLIELLSERKEITTKELMERFNVSGATIRNDLTKLESENRIRRTHGGAVYLEQSTSMKSFESFTSRSHTKVKEKKGIAREAKNLISERTTLMMDASSTVLSLAFLLDSFNRLTIITNGLLTAIEGQKQKNFNVILIGGSLRYDSLAVEGLLGVNLLDNLNADILFTSAHGFTIENGLTDFSIYDVELKKVMVSRAKKVVALLDHSKIGNVSTSSFCKTGDIHTIITDAQTDIKYIQEMRKAGIHVIIASL